MKHYRVSLMVETEFEEISAQQTCERIAAAIRWHLVNRGQVQVVGPIEVEPIAAPPVKTTPISRPQRKPKGGAQ